MGLMLWWKPFAPDDVETLKDLIAAGKVTPVIDRRYPLSEIVEALRYVDEAAQGARSSSRWRDPAGRSRRLPAAIAARMYGCTMRTAATARTMRAVNSAVAWSITIVSRMTMNGALNSTRGSRPSRHR